MTRRIRILALSVACALLPVAPARAMPGDVDATFGVGGWASVAPDDEVSRYANDALLQADGRIVVVGHIAAGRRDARFAVWRLLTNGSLDPSFGEHGLVLLDLGVQRSEALAVDVTSDGRLVVAGRSEDDPIIVRLEADGDLDATFGDAGMAILRLDRITRTTAVEVAPTGSVLVGGHFGPYLGERRGGFLARLAEDGTPDPTFGTDGIELLSARFGDLAVDSRGRIMVLEVSGYDDWFAIERRSADGELDPSFGQQGVRRLTGGKVVDAGSLTVDADGRLLVTLVRFELCTDFGGGVGRLTRRGRWDRTFSVDGRIAFGCMRPQAVAAQPDGGVTVTGTTLGAGSGEYTSSLVRLDPSGVPDPRFGQDGSTVIQRGTSVWFLALVVLLQTDGRIVTVGDRFAPTWNANVDVVRVSGMSPT
jgi:uncharacterized delta-60 repeat protein